jgi:hypothetical protein
MLNSGPFALSLANPVTLTPPSASSRMVAVVLSNFSPFACSVNINGVQAWLDPYTRATYQIPAGGIPVVTPTFTTDPTGTVTSGQLVADWYLPSDPAPPADPQPLTSAAVLAGISGITEVALVNQTLINAQALTIPANTGASLNAGSLVIPNNILSIGVYVQMTAGGSGSPFLLSVNPSGGPPIQSVGAFIGLVRNSSLGLNSQTAGPVCLDVNPAQTGYNLEFWNNDTTSISIQVYVVGFSLPARMVGRPWWQGVMQSVAFTANLGTATTAIATNPQTTGAVAVVDGIFCRNLTGAATNWQLGVGAAATVNMNFDVAVESATVPIFSPTFGRGIRIPPGMSLWGNATTNTNQQLTGFLHWEGFDDQ